MPGFQGMTAWKGFMPGADRLILDYHPYFSFDNMDPTPLAQQATKPCAAWGGAFNQSMSDYGITIAGEWALSFTDCMSILPSSLSQPRLSER